MELELSLFGGGHKLAAAETRGNDRQQPRDDAAAARGEAGITKAGKECWTKAVVGPKQKASNTEAWNYTVTNCLRPEESIFR